MAGQRRPDPHQGIFETLLVHDGRPIELEAHLARLEASLAELYPSQPAPDLREELEATAAGTGSSAIRVTVAPDGPRELGASIEVRRPSGDFLRHSVSKSPRQVWLRSFRLEGGLGPHKWADRLLLDEAQAGLSTEALPLIVDADGAALEASRANLFAVRDGALFTPPLDGRILSGITRRRVLEIAVEGGYETHEEPLSRCDLLAADELFLTGSVRGIEPVASVDGTSLRAAPTTDAGSLVVALAGGLRRAWLGAPVA